MDTASRPRSVEEIFEDYRGRRTALVRALTKDVYEFYGLCRPDRGNLSLYGHPNETWELALRAEVVPPKLPEPTRGINFDRDDLDRRSWLSLVAEHSDSWLLSVAFYHGARLNHHQRQHLFGLINDLPTVFEVVNDRKPIKNKPAVAPKYWGFPERSGDEKGKSMPKPADVDVEDENYERLCGSCGGNYSVYGFWIFCNTCERWFHGKCVKITSLRAESIEQYKCPSCSMKK